MKAYIMESSNAYKMFVRKSLLRLKHRWKDNAKMDLDDVDCGEVTGIPG